MSSSPIVVLKSVILPASSRFGSQAAKLLLQQNLQVRVAARSASKLDSLKSQGAEVVEADLRKPETINAALQNAKALFFINPPVYDADVVQEAERVSKTLVEALRKSSIKRVVFLSSIGAEVPDGTGNIKGLHIIEEALKGLPSKIELVFLRCAYFAENWGQVAHLALSQPFILPSMILPVDAPLSQVSTKDIGTAAAKYLTITSSSLSSTGPTVVELSRPEDASPADIAKVFESLNGGNPVIPVPVEDKDFESTLEKDLPKNVAASIAEMMRAVNSKKIDWSKNGDVIRARGETEIEATLKELV